MSLRAKRSNLAVKGRWNNLKEAEVNISWLLKHFLQSKSVLSALSMIFLRQKGYPPSVRDIAKGCQISSTSVVAYNLARLEEAGYIHRHSDISRGIELLNGWQNRRKVVYIPIVGRIAAGEPIPVPASDTGSVIVEIQGRVVAVIRRMP